MDIIHLNHIVKYSDPSEAIQHLSAHPANIRIDLHGVLDVIPKDIPLIGNREKNKIVCISFVGDCTRFVASEDIHSRIATGQIDYGVLVFKRGKGKSRFQTVDVGSKAWVNKHIPSNGPSIFIDDSTDHLRSTKHLLPEMECVLFNTSIAKQLLRKLRDWDFLIQ